MFHCAGPLDLSVDPPTPASSSIALNLNPAFRCFFWTLTGIDQAVVAVRPVASLFSGPRRRLSKWGLEHGALRRQPLVSDRQLLCAALQTSARIKKK